MRLLWLRVSLQACFPTAPGQPWILLIVARIVKTPSPSAALAPDNPTRISFSTAAAVVFRAEYIGQQAYRQHS